MATTADVQQDSVLDRSFDLTRISWWGVAGTLTVFVAALLRFIGLDWVALSADESRRSMQALAFYDGRPLPGVEIAETSPAHLLAQALSFLLFGTTDVTARVISAVAGVAIVILALRLSPFVGRTAALGMAVAAAISPILLYSSRVAGPETLVAAFAMLLVVAFLHAGKAWSEERSSAAWIAAAGFAVGGMFASGPTSISVLIAITIGLVLAGLAEQGGPGSVRRGAHALTSGMENWIVLIVSLVVTILFFFSRGFSSFSALSGVGDTFSAWGRLLTHETSATPTQFFLLVLLLYEIAIVVTAAAGFIMGADEKPGGLSSVFFLGWFVTALLLFSFSAGRMPEHAVHVALPIILLGGGGAARIVASLRWSGGHWRSSALLVGATAGLIGAVAAFIVAIERASATDDNGRAAFEAIAVVAIAVLPLAIATFVLGRERLHSEATGRGRTIASVVIAALLIFLGAYVVRSTVLLNYYRADTSLEPLAQRTSPPAVLALARQVNNLSRDLTLREPTVADPTGGHGITIAIESDVEWPYLWYFRDYPDATVVAPGESPATGADMIIARESAGMDAAGYTPRFSASRNRVPPEYLTPSVGSVLESIVLPSRWGSGMDFLLYRQGITQPDPETVAVGYGQRLSQQLFTSTGPYALNERVGTGAGRGQFNQPRGIAVNSGDGSIYVVDSANGRVQRFDASGAFIGAWGGPESGVSFEVTAEGLGPTGIEVSFDGLIFVADTWAHRVVVLNSDGQVVREFGSFGDTLDAPTGTDIPGQFFGPRDIATTANEIFVVDTGNERVQVFAPDGTFIRAWGGYGSEPSQFIEPVGIAIGPDDRVYVADSGNGRISVFARDGTPLMQWPVEAWQGQAYFEPYLAFDQYGTLYVTSSGTGTVETYDPNGVHLMTLDNAGAESIEAPIGIALATDNTMRVTDRGIAAVLSLPVFPPLEPPVEEATPDAGTPVAIEATPLAGSPVSSAATPIVAAASPETDVLIASIASPPASPVASPIASPRASPEASPEE